MKCPPLPEAGAARPPPAREMPTGAGGAVKGALPTFSAVKAPFTAADWSASPRLLEFRCPERRVHDVGRVLKGAFMSLGDLNAPSGQCRCRERAVQDVRALAGRGGAVPGRRSGGEDPRSREFG